jgi:predicted  nucleic acid-binding Zn-ribbon protein
MDKLSAKKKVSIIRLYLSGLSYDEITIKAGVSKVTVANVVTELKAGAFPEAADAAEQIELLRELSLDLKHSGLSPGQCAVGLAVVSRIKECGLDVADIDRLPLILKVAGGEEKAKEFVELVYRIHQYQKKSGMTLEQADEKLQALEAKAAQLSPVLKQLEERQAEVKQLTKRRDDLIPVVNNLDQKYGLLNPRVKDLEKREGELLRRIKDQQDTIEKAEATLAALSREKQDTVQKADAVLAALGKGKQQLLEAGFSPAGLAEFNDRTRAIAARQHIAIDALKEKLLHDLESLDKGLGLEVLIDARQTELKKYQQWITLAKKEHESLQGTIAALEQQKAVLEATIGAVRDKVSDEIVKVIPAAREAVTRLTKELQLGNEGVLDEIKRLKDQALEVGKEIGRYEGVIKVNQWLIELMTLVRGEDGLEAQRIKIILLQVLRGGESWMKRNQSKVRFGAPTYSTQRLIGELEEWRI